jgi:hypothetical protein
MTYKTRSEQRLEWLEAEGRTRELTAAEQDELRRAMHAIYCLDLKRRKARRMVAA